MSAVNAIALLDAAGGNNQISRSVRLRSSASAYLSKTFASAGNRKKWTYSAWMKRGTLGTYGALIASKVDGNNYSSLEFSGDELRFVQASGGSITANKRPAQLFRDPSAWYHVIAAMDTDNATAEDRFILYINGTRVTAWAANTPPALGLTTGYINSTTAQWIGLDANPLYFDGYLAEINFIDGQALTPSSFGETDTITGVWKPKAFSGTYGTNGFYLNFSDNSAATAAAIGKDNSGNGNNWTPNNISVTSGVTYDSMTDVPTLNSATASNFAVLNPLTGEGALSDGNLKVLTTVGDNAGRRTTMPIPSTGKWYWEFMQTNYYYGDACLSGITNVALTSKVLYFGYDGTKNVDGTYTSYGSAYSNNVLIGVAVDVDAGTVTFYRNNTSQGSISYSFTGKEMYPWFNDGSGGWQSEIAVNFGQRPFAYTPPTGFKALNTFNLPDSTITKGSAYFDVKARTGANGATPVSGLGFQPDFVWVKGRNVTVDHALFDSVRGASKTLYSSNTDAEATNDIYGYLSAFNSSGYSFTAGSTNIARVDSSSYNYVDWVWKESVSAGFDIVTYTGAAGAQTIAHSLGVAPSMYIVKSRSGVADWGVYHKSIGAGNALFLDLTNASTAGSVWNNTAPTSSVFSVGSGSFVNTTGVNYVAYLFAEVAGYSKFGSYVGNSSTDGTFVYTGFKPRFILHKPSSTTGQWMMWDTARNTYNVLTNSELLANSTSVEGNGGWGTQIDILSNGFKFRGSDNANFNQSGVTYVYACFAENPFKNSLAR